MRLSVIIVNWNTKEKLGNCISSLSFVKELGEVIVVDNGSVDGSVELVKEKYGWVKLIENSKNLGFAKANNLGIEVADGEFLFILNSDTLVNEKAVLSMMDFLKERDEVGFVGCRLVDGKEVIQKSFGYFPTFFNFLDYVLIRPSFEENPDKFKQPIEVGFLLGACLMLKRELIERIGVFDSSYFMYYEDVDWCLRVERVGFKNYYLPEVSIIHYGESSINKIRGEQMGYLRKSRKIFISKFRGKILADFYDCWMKLRGR